MVGLGPLVKLLGLVSANDPDRVNVPPSWHERVVATSWLLIAVGLLPPLIGGAQAQGAGRRGLTSLAVPGAMFIGGPSSGLAPNSFRGWAELAVILIVGIVGAAIIVFAITRAVVDEFDIDGELVAIPLLLFVASLACLIVDFSVDLSVFGMKHSRSAALSLCAPVCS